MRRACFILTFFISLLTLADRRPFVVVIDPGHGGIDSGAVREIFKESEITLKVAQKISDLIQADYSQNVHVVLTRATNQSLSLEKRVRTAEKHRADLFLSLHANSSDADSVRGMEFYFKKGLYKPRISPGLTTPPTGSANVVQKIVSDLTQFGQISHSLKFNQLLQRKMHSSENPTKTVIKRAPYFVIEKTSMPSALIEVGFISNLSEAKLLLTDKRQQEIAETIVKSIYDYKKLTFDTTATN